MTHRGSLNEEEIRKVTLFNNMVKMEQGWQYWKLELGVEGPDDVDRLVSSISLLGLVLTDEDCVFIESEKESLSKQNVRAERIRNTYRNGRPLK